MGENNKVKNVNVSGLFSNCGGNHLSAGVQKLCRLLPFYVKDEHYSRSSYWLALLVGIPYALASLSRMCALYYGK